MVGDDSGIAACITAPKTFANNLYRDNTVSQTRRNHKAGNLGLCGDWNLISIMCLVSDRLFGTCGSISALSAVKIRTRYVCTLLFILMVNVVLHLASFRSPAWKAKAAVGCQQSPEGTWKGENCNCNIQFQLSQPLPEKNTD